MYRNAPIGDIGRMDEKITIKKIVKTKSELNALVETEETLDTVFAAIEYMARKQLEQSQGGQEVSFQQVSFKIRYRTDIDKTCFIEFEGEKFDIISIMKDVGRRQFLELITELRA